MRECIREVTAALQTLGRPDPWSADVKASDDFLNPLFDRFFRKLDLPNLLQKTDYHVLAGLVPAQMLDHLRKHPASRPTRKRTLVSYSLALLGNNITEDRIHVLIEGLLQSKQLTIDANGAVTYHVTT